MRVHDSQAYRKMDVTRERINRIFELREILLSFQTGFSSGHMSTLLVLSAIYLFVNVSFSPDIILCGLLGLKHQLTKKNKKIKI